MKEEKIKHLEFIQNVISRMNTNSFQLKTWSVTIVAALLTIFASTQKKGFILLCILPTMIIWFLDSYYLQQERKFRSLYNDASAETGKKISVFSMNISDYKPNSVFKILDKHHFVNVMFSKTIWPLYLFMILFFALLYTYLI